MVYFPNAIILQETLEYGDIFGESLYKIMSGWSFVIYDEKGRSRGLALAFKDSSIKLLNSQGLDMIFGA